jgi:ribonuclease VapC
MVVDSSALIAVLRKEPGWAALNRALLQASRVRISAATVAESGIVGEMRFGPAFAARLDALLAKYGAEILPVTAERALLVRDAYRRFGKGRHAAGLDFGDCFAYALARELDEPLLFVGDDFGLTDIADALAS